METTSLTESEIGMSKAGTKPQQVIFTHIDGRCLDSDLCPIRIKEGDVLSAYQIQLTEWSIVDNIGKVVCFILKNGNAFVKQLIFWDGISWGITVKMFVPEEKSFFVSLSSIESMYVVDEVLRPECYTPKIKAAVA